jgi:hypothetical protein
MGLVNRVGIVMTKLVDYFLDFLVIALVCSISDNFFQPRVSSVSVFEVFVLPKGEGMHAYSKAPCFLRS